MPWTIAYPLWRDPKHPNCVSCLGTKCTKAAVFCRCPAQEEAEQFIRGVMI